MILETRIILISSEQNANASHLGPSFPQPDKGPGDVHLWSADGWQEKPSVSQRAWSCSVSGFPMMGALREDMFPVLPK